MFEVNELSVTSLRPVNSSKPWALYSRSRSDLQHMYFVDKGALSLAVMIPLAIAMRIWLTTAPFIL